MLPGCIMYIVTLRTEYSIIIIIFIYVLHKRHLIHYSITLACIALMKWPWHLLSLTIGMYIIACHICTNLPGTVYFTNVLCKRISGSYFLKALLYLKILQRFYHCRNCTAARCAFTKWSVLLLLLRRIIAVAVRSCRHIYNFVYRSRGMP